MALDEALFRSALEGSSLPTLRLYRFAQPTLSFGYGQRLEEVCRPDACRRLGVAWVRRPTGGRALLHHHELTYAVTAPARGQLARLSVRGAYDRVNAGLASALARLGVLLDPPLARSQRDPAARGAGVPLPCLARPDVHELTAGGRKLVASAQRRRRAGFLQHGSILRTIDASLWEEIRPSKDGHPLAAVGLDELAPRPVDEARLRAALAAAFEELFAEPPSEAEPTPAELAAAERLEAKYRSEAWNRPGAIPEC
jgi:lipoate-protein ligase A